MSKTWSRRWAYWMGFLKGELVHPLTFPKTDNFKHASNAMVINAINPYMEAGGRFDAQDTSCAMPTRRWLEDEWFPWWIKFLNRFDLSYHRGWDCDDYALTFWAMARMAYSKDMGDSDTIAIGYLKAQGHVINFALIDDGELVFIEPQGPKFVARPHGIYWAQF